jgi:hypothetical protein
MSTRWIASFFVCFRVYGMSYYVEPEAVVCLQTGTVGCVTRMSLACTFLHAVFQPQNKTSVRACHTLSSQPYGR